MFQIYLICDHQAEKNCHGSSLDLNIWSISTLDTVKFEENKRILTLEALRGWGGGVKLTTPRFLWI